jgi:hypothetical protein
LTLQASVGSLRHVRRIIALFLLALLPVHFAGSAVASYCQHEQGKAAQHVGHHEHEHDAAAEPQPESSSAGQHADCCICHAGCVAVTSPPLALGLSFGVVPARSGAFAVLPAPASGLERPNWSRLA